MRTGRPKVALILTADERQRLESLAHRSRSAAAAGAPGAHDLGVCGGHRQQGGRATVARHAGDGVQMARALRRASGSTACTTNRGRARSGRSPTSRWKRVIIRTLETTPRGATHWSTREHGEGRSGLSHMTISRMWRTFGLQPHRSETFKLSTDPLLIDKVRDIVGPVSGSAGACRRVLRRREAADSGARSHAAAAADAARARPSGGRTTTSGTARRRCLRRWMQDGRGDRGVSSAPSIDGVPRVPGSDRRAGAGRSGRAHHHGQLRHAQDAVDPATGWRSGRAFTCTSRPTYGIVAQSGGALVRRVDDEANATGRVSQRAATRKRRSGIHRGASGEPEAVRVDEECR